MASIDLLRRREDGNGDGQVVAASMFGEIGGCQVDHDPALGIPEADVLDGATYPVASFAHGGLRHTDESERRRSSLAVGFHENLGCIDAHLGSGSDSDRHDPRV